MVYVQVICLRFHYKTIQSFIFNLQPFLFTTILINLLMGSCFTRPQTQRKQQQKNDIIIPNQHPQIILKYHEVVEKPLLKSKEIHDENGSQANKTKWLNIEEYSGEQKNISEILMLYERAMHYYEEHDIDTAYDYCLKIEESLLKNQSQQQNSSSPQLIQQKLKKFQQLQANNINLNCFKFDFQQLLQIKVQYKDVKHYEEEIQGANWNQQSNSNGLKISTRNQNGAAGVLIEKQIDIPFEQLISVLIQMDLYHEFVPFNEISRQQKIFSRNCRIGYNLNNYPFLSKREAFFQGIGYNRLDHTQQLFLFTRSFHDNETLSQHLKYKCKVNPDYVQLNYKYFIVKYQPIKKGLGKITIAVNADIGLNFLPFFILEYLAKDFAQDFFKNIVRISTNFKGSPWETNTHKTPQLFNFFQNATQNYLIKNNLNYS